MGRKDEENKDTPEPTSPQKIATELLTTIILLAGTWIIEKLKSTFENTLPLAIIIILINL